jgi:hypothetical protein
MTYDEYEYSTELDRAVTPGGNAYPVVRVRYRREGARRWVTFLLVPDDGERFADVFWKIGPAIDAHAHRGGSL